MIESIEFQNFKVLRNATLPLGRLTLIVGPNGSGKSTAIQALRFAIWGNASFQEIVTADLRSKGQDTVKVIIQMGAENAGMIRRTVWNAGGSNVSFDSPGPQVAVDSELRRTRFFSLDAQAISPAVNLTPDDELLQNGERLAGVLDRLRDQSEERFEALNDALGQWLPEFDRILFDTPGQGMRAFALRMRNGHHRIAAVDLSQGTLLALAILTLAYLPDPPPLVCFEEPDRGIHPRLLRDVQDALYRLSYPENYGEAREPVQVIATTHSPYFLDLFRDHPEEVVIAEKTDEGTMFVRLSDLPDVEEILRDSHLGEVWYTGILGGVPAHP